MLFILTLASGVWLGQAGKPLNTAIFNVHKLIALAMVVLTAIQISRSIKNVEVQALLITLIVVICLCVLALFATGALMSLGKLNFNILQITHLVTSILATIAVVATVYLLTGRPS